MTDANLGKRAVRGTVWAAIDHFGVMGIMFVTNLIMARILSVTDYGLVVMITLFTNVSAILIDGGFGNAIIHKKAPTQTDLSTAFFWNFGLAVALYSLLFVCAPPIARLYGEPELVGVLRGIALTLIFNSLIIVQVSKLRKQFAFSSLAIVNISAALTGGIAGIAMAKSGFGVYSLVWSQVIAGAMQFAVITLASRWRPSFTFSAAAFKELFSYGGNLLAANVLQVFCNNIQNLIIGLKFSGTQSGLYSQAQKIDQIVSNQVPQILVQVMFPLYSRLQDDDSQLRKALSMNMRVIAFSIFPVITMLIILAAPIFELLYGSKWLEAAPYFQVLCCGGFFVALQNINFYAVAAKGHSRTLLHWSYYKWGMLLALISTGMNFGIYGLLWALVLSNVNIFMVNASLASRHVGFKVSRQLAILAPLFGLSLFCAAAALLITTAADISPWFTIAVFAILYPATAFVFRMQALADTISALRRLGVRSE